MLLRSSKNWETFLEGHPQWFVVFDELSRMPNKAFGDPFSLNTNDPITMLNKIAGDHLSTYFTSNLDLRLEKDVNTKKYNLAFKLYPTDITQVISFAEKKKFMPQKSTWFHPKPLDGIVCSRIIS